MAHAGGGRPAFLALRRLSSEVARAGFSGTRELEARPFTSWDEALDALAEERRPLFGRFGLRLAVHPFRPHEAGLLLDPLDGPARAQVWGLLGEGQLLLATEGDPGGLAGRVLAAVAVGRTGFSEIKDAVRTDPTRTLERLVRTRLLERVVPVTEDPARSRRAVYRIADNVLAFWLGIVDRYRSEIDRGLGPTILAVVLESLDEFLRHRFEEAFRQHLRHRAAAGEFGDVVAVGPFWSGGGNEIDAVLLAGRAPSAVLTGEAKWSRSVDARQLEAVLRQRAASLPRAADPLRLSTAARSEVRNAAPDTLIVTAADIFGGR